MATKLKIKMGHIEFEYEGDSPFDTEAIKELFTHIESLMGAAPAGAFDNPPAFPVDDPPIHLGELGKLAANTVAARLGVNSGPDMVIAAAAHLQVCSGKDSFSRKELLSTMQSAKTYYKASMSGNLSKYLDTLISSKRINSLNNDEMSLSAAEQESLRNKLVDR